MVQKRQVKTEACQRMQPQQAKLQNQSDDTTTAAGTGSASDETANKDNQKDSGDTTIILTGDVLFANAFKAPMMPAGSSVSSHRNC